MFCGCRCCVSVTRFVQGEVRAGDRQVVWGSKCNVSLLGERSFWFLEYS